MSDIYAENHQKDPDNKPGFEWQYALKDMERTALLHGSWETGLGKFRTYYPLNESGESLDFAPLRNSFNHHPSWNVWRINAKGIPFILFGQIWYDQGQFHFYAFRQDYSFTEGRYIEAFKRSQNATANRS